MKDYSRKGISPEFLEGTNVSSYDQKLNEKILLEKEYYSVVREKMDLDLELGNLMLEDNKKTMGHLSNGIALALNVGAVALGVVSTVLLLCKSEEK